jgi:YVTN family beta-propeller protein
VANYGNPNRSGGNYVSVINSLTNTISDTIILPAGSTGPYGLINSGSNLYLSNYRSNNLSVINPATKTVTATVSLGERPRDISAVTNLVYVSNFGDGTISTINPISNMVTAITTSGHSPSGMGIFGGLLYFARSQDNFVSVLNASDSTLYTHTTVTSSSSGGGSLSSNQTTTTTPSSPQTPPASPEAPNSGQETVVQKIDELLVKRLKGRLLLAVEDHGKIWYVDTVSGRRYEVTLSNALNLFRALSLGITDKNLAQIPVAGLGRRVSALALRLRGKLLLQTEQRGEIWYVDTKGYRHQLTVLNLLDVFRNLALGITNEDLAKILIGENK